MHELETVKQWLLGYPAWDEDSLLYIDYTDAVPGNTGLFPRGMETVDSREDVVGNRRVNCRYHFALYRVAKRREEDAAWLLEFQKWVQQQSAAGLAPRFGDVAAEERMWAGDGKLHKAEGSGVVTYTVTLTAEFTKLYNA